MLIPFNKASFEMRSRGARTEPPLDETLRMLLPLAPTLETLALGDNELCGTITDDIASFAKLNTLYLARMGIKGTLA